MRKSYTIKYNFVFVFSKRMWSLQHFLCIWNSLQSYYNCMLYDYMIIYLNYSEFSHSNCTPFFCWFGVNVKQKRNYFNFKLFSSLFMFQEVDRPITKLAFIKCHSELIFNKCYISFPGKCLVKILLQFLQTVRIGSCVKSWLHISEKETVNKRRKVGTIYIFRHSNKWKVIPELYEW